MSEPLVNVDQFRDRPVNAVSGLVPDQASAGLVVDALRAGGTDVSDVGVLHGSAGVRILDRAGDEHGRRAKLVRFFQKWGYDDAVMSLYDEGLRKGESVVVVPAARDAKDDIVGLLHHHRGHALYYFGTGSAESIGGP